MKKTLLVVLVAALIFAFATTAFALPDAVSYSSGGFSNWFYTTNTTAKTASDQNWYRDLNSYFERVSDDSTSGYFNVRLYTSGGSKAADYFESKNGGYKCAGLFPAYQGDTTGVAYKLKVENKQTGTSYRISGSYRLLNYSF